MPETTQKLLADAALVISALREYIQAIPVDAAASFPAMPGIDGDWVEDVQDRLRVTTKIYLSPELCEMPIATSSN